MKSKVLKIYACLSAVFILIFCLFFLGICSDNIWLLTRNYVGFSKNAWWLFPGVIIVVLFVSFKNLLLEQTVRNLVGLMNLLTICYFLPLISDFVAYDKAVERILTTTDDVGYGTEGNSISLSEALDYVEKIHAVGEAELDFLRTYGVITKKHWPETLMDKAFKWALLALPAGVFIYGNILLLFLSRDELSRPLSDEGVGVNTRG